jgi:hypothetical protein
MDRKERLKELLDKQKQKTMAEEKDKQYELVLEVVMDLFPNSYSDTEEVEILSEESSDTIKNNLLHTYPFTHNGIDWTFMFHKAIFSIHTDYESALVELLGKNLKCKNDTRCYLVDNKYPYVIKTKLSNVISRVEEVREWMWDGFIFSPELQLVIEFPSNDVAIGWKV